MQKEAIALAEAAGVERGSITVIEFIELPLAYLPGNAVQVKVKVAGNLLQQARHDETLPSGHRLGACHISR
ncbi:hypothetical protein [Candidatus Symbiopectobacterium sp.]|uniref:hypothetical protein n=1 Tax=Candidatus Symbiopectobacterium sp. TaxID=2816440 RepID=UPI0025C54143|nr:hypothetical protein [Candidatus Symbiopectobacterium sp.]